MLGQVRTVKVGTLVPQQVDATLDMFGVTWFRVHGGFGGRFDREDWIADLSVSVSVCDYNWNGEDFGESFGSFENACRMTLQQALRRARLEKAKAEARCTDLAAVIARLEQIPAEPAEDAAR